MSYRLGLKKLDVTPPAGCIQAGYAARTEPSTSVYLPLTAAVIALSDDNTTLLLVSIEWLGFYDQTDATRQAIQARTGIPYDHILLLGTHTHCGPAMRSLDARRHGAHTLDSDYLAQTIERLAEAAGEAMADRHPVSLSTGLDWCGFAASRRKPDDKGGVLWEPSLDAPHDHEVPVVVARDEAGEVPLVLLSYACHPTSTGPILEIGGDYPGFAMVHVESMLPGATAVFAKGCGGDQKPGFRDDKTGGFRKATIPEVERIGTDLAKAVLRAVRRDGGTVSGPLYVRSGMATLTTDPLDETLIPKLAESKVEAERAWANYYADRLKAGKALERDVSIEIQSVTIGDDLAIVTMAGEMTVEYGLRIKRELGARFGCVMPLGYANQGIGYVPVDRQLPEGGYEVIANQRALLRTGPFECGTEDRVMEAVRKTIAR